MSEIEYPSSLIYLVGELCIESKTLQRNLIEDNNKSSPMVINVTESKLSVSFSNIMAIKSGSDVNLLGSDNFIKEESRDKFCE
ncbi:hypothetical protein B296_00036033 [Ensete ventricosum]|uniref:Uncharacterized protein n=1 Tax=Ensete ventricosum TaxID=4639 RepID=A0A426XC30_ENSVE|nr:hypothetical protein B296_00036033 [Ensete ventricosum]